MKVQDLQQIDELLQKRLKENLKNFPTKADLKAVLKETTTEIKEDLSEQIRNFVQVTSDKKADNDLAISHEVRLNKLEEKVFPQN